MKLQYRAARATFNPLKSLRGVLVSLGLLVAALTAYAQDVVAPPTMSDVVPAAQQQAQAAKNPSPSLSVPSAAPETPVFQWGPLDAHLAISYRYLYGDGIPAASGQHLTTSIHNIAPDFLVDLGTHWSLDYVPTWVFYSNRAFTDTVDQSVRLAGWGAYEDWVLNLSGGYGTSSSPTIQTGRQTKQVSSSTSLDATYSINSKLGLELTAAQTYQSAESFTSSHDWSTTDWLHYKVAPRLDTAVGLGFGYVTVSLGSDMTYMRPQAQMTWRPTDKITLGVHGGVESRRSLGDNAATQNNPIYGASVQYQPFETTTLALAVDHAVAATYFEDQLTKSTGWTATLQQRLLESFYLSIGVSHQKAAYISALGGADAGRNDDTNSFNARLSTVLFGRCTLAAIYQDTRNSSAVAGFGLSSRQVGLEFSYRF